MSRQRSVVFLIALVFLASLWACRLPKLCLYSDCVGDITTGPLPQTNVDLSHAGSPFVSWPLQRVCSETTWRPGVVFVCDNNSGGIGNIRNYILTCVRYAIEAGVTGIVLPQIRTRSEADLSNLGLPHRDFSYFFDEAHFRSALHATCPRITIYNTADDIPHAPQPFRAEQFRPRDLGKRGGCDSRELNKHTGRFGMSFHAHLERTTLEFNLPPPSPIHPRILRFAWGVQWDWPVYRDGPEFVATFGGLLRFRKDILELGQRTASYMQSFALSNGGSPSFAGMHLRTENDALNSWPKFEDQAEAYIGRAAIAMKFKAAYLATGNKTEAQKLSRAASASHGMAVITKHELLKDHPSDLTQLEALTWDQQALIDFIVLLESGYFLGVSPSSFSMNVALKRHLKTGGLHTRPWKIGGDGDDWSWLVGNYEKYWVDWLFMYDSLWP